MRPHDYVASTVVGGFTGYCRHCDRSFTREHNFLKHRLSPRCLGNISSRPNVRSVRITHKCETCDKTFFSKQSLQRHRAAFHLGFSSFMFPCGVCDEFFASSAEELERHRAEQHRPHTDFKVVKSAHNRSCQLLRAFVPTDRKSVCEALTWAYESLLKTILTALSVFALFKVNLVAWVEMYRVDESLVVVQSEVFPFRAMGFQVVRSVAYDEELRKSLGDIDSNITEFLHRGSGWIVNRVLQVDLELARCHLLSGRGCGLHETVWKKGHGLQVTSIHPGDSDGLCFLFAVARRLMPPKDRDEPGLVLWFVRNALAWPEKWSHETVRRRGVLVSEIDSFEEANANWDIKINVVGLDDGGRDIIPIRASRNRQAQVTVNLLLVYAPSALGGYPGHYSYVQDLGKLVARKKTDPSTGAIVSSHSRFVCPNCFNTSATLGGFESHLDFCLKEKEQRIKMPEEGSVLSFDKAEEHDAKTFKSAFMVFFDFETLQVPPPAPCSCSAERRKRTNEDQDMRAAFEALPREKQVELAMEQMMMDAEAAAVVEGKVFDRQHGLARGEPDKVKPPKPKYVTDAFREPVGLCTHKTEVLAEQPPFCYSLALINRNGDLLERESYQGADCADHFVLRLLELADRYLPTLTPGVKMRPLLPGEEARLRSVDGCYLCGEPMSAEEAVLDHDHLDAEPKGYAHSWCNLRRRERYTLTAFAHNFSGFDSHCLVRSLHRLLKNGRISRLQTIPLTTQKFKSVKIDHRITILDSLAFLDMGLQDVVEMLKRSSSEFPVLSQACNPADDAEGFDLLTRKGVYPYGFATSIRALEEADALPPPEAFRNDLTGEDVSDADYQFAKRVWSHFACRDMMEYTTLYVSSDVLLLADGLLDFRNRVWDIFELDLCKFLSIPHLSLEAMLRHTGVKIELVSDQEMSYTMRSGIRGGHSFVGTRYFRVTDPAKECALYLDENNLYGWSMCQPLPIGRFRWATQTELAAMTALWIMSLADDAEQGLFLVVDIDYPRSKHLLHQAMPLLPEKITVTEEDLSPYSRRCNDKFKHKEGASHKSEKLSATFRHRRRYFLHYRTLKFALRQGLKLRKVHSAILFKQERFMAGFIELCTKMRQEAKTETERQLWKLLANSCYGKFIENVSKRMDAFFDTCERDFIRRSTNPLYKGSLICEDDFTISFLKKKRDLMRQCHHVGAAILELAKLRLYEHFYDHIQPAFGHESVDIGLSDTDSLVLYIRGCDVDTAMARLAPIMDFSNLPRDHPLYDSSRAKVPGYLKNECPANPLVEVAAVKTKSYFCKAHRGDCYDGCTCKATAKGVKRSVRDRLGIDHYKSCIFGVSQVNVEQTMIAPKDHKNRLVRMQKVAFSSLDDKRYQLCHLHSAPYGSRLIQFAEAGYGCFLCRRSAGESSALLESYLDMADGALDPDN